MAALDQRELDDELTQEMRQWLERLLYQWCERRGYSECAVIALIRRELLQHERASGNTSRQWTGPIPEPQEPE